MKFEIPLQQAQEVYTQLAGQFNSATVTCFVRALGAAIHAANEPEEPTDVTQLTLQQRLYNWQLCNFGEPNIEHLKLGVCEEVGELCHAVLKHAQGIRGFDDETYYIDQASDAIADATIYLIQIYSVLGMPFTYCDSGYQDDLIEATFTCCEVSAALAATGDPASSVEEVRTALHCAATTLEVDYRSLVERVAEQVMKRDWTE